MEYIDGFTLDGLVMPPKGVTKESVGKVAEYITQARRGDRIAEARIAQSLMSGDLAASVAHLINLITIPQLPDRKLRPVSKLAGQRSLPDFRPATLFSLFGKLEGPGQIKTDVDFVGSAPRVPQGSPYPVVTVTGVESAYAKLAKNGLRVNWDFEDFINDTLGVLDAIPSELQQIALQTEWREVGDAILKATTPLNAVTLPDGTAEPANAKVTAKTIMGAIQQLALTRLHGNLIGTLAGYNVVVPYGSKLYVDYSLRLAQGITAILPPAATGGYATIPPDFSVLSNVEVIEHESVLGSNWYLIPKPGAYSRPILEVLNLRGYETPQLRYKHSADGGDGFSYDTDSASLRLRMVTGAALWFQEAIIWSTGANAAVA